MNTLVPFRQLKDLYLSIWLLSYRITRWKGQMKAYSASMATITFEGLLAFDCAAWAEIWTRHRLIQRWEIWLAAVALALTHRKLDKHGMAFEKKFNLFDDTKRTILYATAALF